MFATENRADDVRRQYCETKEPRRIRRNDALGLISRAVSRDRSRDWRAGRPPPPSGRQPGAGDDEWTVVALLSDCYSSIFCLNNAVRRSVTGSRLAGNSSVMHSWVSRRPFVFDPASKGCSRKDDERSIVLVLRPCCCLRKT